MQPDTATAAPDTVPRIVLSGGPGVGKTTVLHELARRGHRVFGDSARAVIQDRKARGWSPRPDAVSFAREILARDEAQYAQAASVEGWAFFDRSALEPIGMLHQQGAIPHDELVRLLGRYTYHRTVFVFPPWPQIYAQDEERDHTFEHCVRVHHETVGWTTQCGYTVHEVGPGPVAQRVADVLSSLARGGA